MSVEKKYQSPPPSNIPPYARETRCWGCEQLFDAYSEMRPGDQGLCPQCAKFVTKTG